MLGVELENLTRGGINKMGYFSYSTAKGGSAGPGFGSWAAAELTGMDFLSPAFVVEVRLPLFRSAHLRAAEKVEELSAMANSSDGEGFRSCEALLAFWVREWLYKDKCSGESYKTLSTSAIEV